MKLHVADVEQRFAQEVLPEKRLTIQKKLKREIEKSNRKIVVLDDDPTGVQTVHDIYVYTDWQLKTLQDGFAAPQNLFYILTNSRAFSKEKTARVHYEIAQTVRDVSGKSNRNFLLVSRGDSTLRGHYPLETDTMANVLGSGAVDGLVLMPFFKEAGRVTIDNVHYVQMGDWYVPCAETEFAQDKTFGYTHSNLCEYIEEKTNGAYKKQDVVCVDLEDLRACRLEKIEQQLLSCENGQPIVVNALDYIDAEVFCLALYRALNKGKEFLFRVAASFVQVVGGISPQPLLTVEELYPQSIKSKNGGVIIVGSHTAKTTAQLQKVLAITGVESVEFNASLVLENKLEEETERVRTVVENKITAGQTVAVYTSRKLITPQNDTPEKALERSVRISQALQSVVANLKVTPKYVLAKGGITSSDIGVKALRVKKALVLGQVAAGVPVWQTDAASRFPQIPYVIFPGNVGTDETLCEVVETLEGKNGFANR